MTVTGSRGGAGGGSIGFTFVTAVIAVLCGGGAGVSTCTSGGGTKGGGGGWNSRRRRRRFYLFMRRLRNDLGLDRRRYHFDRPRRQAGHQRIDDADMKDDDKRQPDQPAIAQIVSRIGQGQNSFRAPRKMVRRGPYCGAARRRQLARV